MKRLLAGAAVLAIASAASAQEIQPGFAQRRLMEVDKAQLEGKLKAAIEMRTTAGAPYSAEAITDFQQTLPDGNRIVRKSIVRIYRDSEGRVRRENVRTDGTTVESITIVDPVAETSVILDAHGKAERLRMVMPDGGRPAPALEERKKAEQAMIRRKIESRDLPSSSAPRIPRSALHENVSREDLGQRTIEGVSARGTRTTTTIPAGAIGNEQPIRIVSEEWFSPDLQVLVLTKHNDPRSGETTYTLSNIVRAEPDRSLFEIPADYTRK